MSTKILSLLGAPGSGKGTQAEILAKEYGYVHIVTGDLIRAEREKANHDEMAREITQRYDEGIPQPDHVVRDLVLEKAEEDISVPGLIFDPFPLSLRQADILEHWANKHADEVELPVLLYVYVSEEESVKRLLLRAKKEGRSDDKEKVIRFRYSEYAARAEQLKNYYTKRKRYIEIDGTPAIEEVTKKMISALSAHNLL